MDEGLRCYIYSREIQNNLLSRFDGGQYMLRADPSHHVLIFCKSPGQVADLHLRKSRSKFPQVNRTFGGLFCGLPAEYARRIASIVRSKLQSLWRPISMATTVPCQAGRSSYKSWRSRDGSECSTKVSRFLTRRRR